MSEELKCGDIFKHTNTGGFVMILEVTDEFIKTYNYKQEMLHTFDYDAWYKVRKWLERHEPEQAQGTDCIGEVIELLDRMCVDKTSQYCRTAIRNKLQAFQKSHVVIGVAKLEGMKRTQPYEKDISFMDGFNYCIDELIQSAKEK